MTDSLPPGTLVELNGRPGVVVQAPAPEGHAAIWFGDVTAGTTTPEVWTVPVEYLEPGQPPAIMH